MDKKILLTIGGSDPSGGAGIEADIRTAERLGVYPCAVVSAITAQNTIKFSDCWPVSDKIFRAQMESVLTDIRPDAVKIGMLPSPQLVKIAGEMLKEFHAVNVVVDPVLSPTLRVARVSHNLIESYFDWIFPIADLVTPNEDELRAFEEMSGIPLQWVCRAWMEKGGHKTPEDPTSGTITDTLFIRKPGGETTGENDLHSRPIDMPHHTSGPFPTIEPHPYAELDFNAEEEEGDFVVEDYPFTHKRIKTENTHGTGCVLSSAIACHLAQGDTLPEAVGKAIEFVDSALKQSANFQLGKGKYGPALI